VPCPNLVQSTWQSCVYHYGTPNPNCLFYDQNYKLFKLTYFFYDGTSLYKL
jgi:hypothetical protein